MEAATAAPRPASAMMNLRRELYCFLVATRTAMLPTLPGEAAAQIRLRYRAAISQVAALRPANHNAAMTAARHVAAGAHSDEALRLATRGAGDPALVMRLQRQAAGMMREVRGFRALLSRVQAERRRRCHGTPEQDARTAHIALEMMTQALDEPAPGPPRAPPPPARPRAAPRLVPAQCRRADAADRPGPLQSVGGRVALPASAAILRAPAVGDEALVREPELAAQYAPA